MQTETSHFNHPFVVKIGTDIISIKRINGVYQKFGDKFLNKILTPAEINYCNINNKININKVAKRFAAKEAFSKALGSGFGKNLFWHDIKLLNNQNNKPYLKISPKITAFIEEHFKVKNFLLEVSLSDDDNFAIAVVQLFGYNI